MDYYRQNELPETVRRYKTYTEQFQTWLLKTALQRGIEIANIVSDQGKEGKGRNRSSYKLPVDKQEQLVNAIAATSAPLTDTSGLNDLADALRSRKEVAQYHRNNNLADAGHSFFNRNLESFRATLQNLVPNLYGARQREDEEPAFIFVRFSTQNTTSDEQDEQDELLEEMRKQDELKMDDDGEKLPTPKPKKMTVDPGANPLTEDEEVLQREFKILSFLYTLNRIREAVREVWYAYHKGGVSAITAALVTDLAQSHIHQTVDALIEEMELRSGDLGLIVPELFSRLNTKLKETDQPDAPLSGKALRSLFCIDSAISYKAYSSKRTSENDAADGPESKYFFSHFLEFFDRIRRSELKLPKWDHFTQELLVHQSSSRDYLPFGLQIVLDIQGVIHQDHHQLLRDLTEHGLDVARCMRYHIEYEDYMWSVGTKPDYLSRDEVKFSSFYLKALNTLLGWIRDVLKAQDAPVEEKGMSASLFITVHATLAGLSMWHFNTLYQQTAIAKIQWFLNGLAHLYNAARQIGGLNVPWPDLEYIIHTHGSNRIFHGDRPTHPEDFLARYFISRTVSSRAFSSDWRTKGKYMPRVNRKVAMKRGLVIELPLERHLRNFYGPDPDKDKWIRRHALFHYLYKKQEEETAATRKSKGKAKGKADDAPDSSSPKDQDKPDTLHHTFTHLAHLLSPPKLRRRRKTKPRVRIPEFSTEEEMHAGLLSTMKTELHSNELHTCFDYLSFYRRAYALILRIRNTVLLSDEIQQQRSAETDTAPEVSNMALIVELFRGLRLESEMEGKKEETPTQELSMKVVPLEQITRIAELMREVICREGDVEVRRARMRRERK